MRLLLAAAITSLVVAAPAGAGQWHPTADWLAEARCIHQHEGPWTANTGNGYFGGMQFSAATWRRMNGPQDPAFAHPGDPAYPFAVPPLKQLHVAWLVWLRDGRSWRSWGTVGAGCARMHAP